MKTKQKSAPALSLYSIWGRPEETDKTQCMVDKYNGWVLEDGRVTRTDQARWVIGDVRSG